MKGFKTKIIALAIAVITCACGAGCSSLSKTQKGAAIGAGAGATVGGLIGKAAGNTALGSIIGGAIGGTAGAYIGHTIDSQAPIKQTVIGATLTRRKDGIVVKFDPGILFDPGKVSLSPAVQVSLQNLAASMKNDPQTHITIIGHTDSLETAVNNMNLSLKRAKAVKAYIVANGVSDKRIATTGKGGTEPVADNSTDEGRAKNRRVEIVMADNEQGKK